MTPEEFFLNVATRLRSSAIAGNDPISIELVGTRAEWEEILTLGEQVKHMDDALRSLLVALDTTQERFPGHATQYLKDVAIPRARAALTRPLDEGDRIEMNLLATLAVIADITSALHSADMTGEHRARINRLAMEAIGKVRT